MAVQQGFLYEKNTGDFLKKYNLCDGLPAGASHTRPDLMLTVRGEQAGCELKISPTAGGSLVLKAYENKIPRWQFGEIDHDETEKQFLKDLAISSGALKKVSEFWNKPVYNIADRTPALEKFMLKIPLKERYKADLIACPDVREKVFSDSMTKYYNLKNTYYINIGTHGFYLLGTKDPLNLNKRMKETKKDLIPLFENACKITARIRCQSKGVTKADAAEKSKGAIGAQGYQFTFTIEFSIPAGSISPYNIAPINGKSVSIIENKVKLDCLL